MRFRPRRYDGEPDAETAALLDVITSPGGLLLRASGGSSGNRAHGRSSDDPANYPDGRDGYVPFEPR